MWLIRAALRRPISVIVIVVALALSSILAFLRTRIDIFPELESASHLRGAALWRYEPAADGRVSSYYYEYHFLYINGIENVEAKSHSGHGAAPPDVSIPART